MDWENEHHFDLYPCEMCGRKSYFWEIKQVQVGSRFWDTCDICREKIEKFIEKKVINIEKVEKGRL